MTPQIGRFLGAAAALLLSKWAQCRGRSDVGVSCQREEEEEGGEGGEGGEGEVAVLSTVLEEAEEGAAGEGAVVADMVIGQALLGKGNPALITNYSESVHARRWESVNILIVTKTGLSFYLAS